MSEKITLYKCVRCGKLEKTAVKARECCGWGFEKVFSEPPKRIEFMPRM